jgi:hypothetical protein
LFFFAFTQKEPKKSEQKKACLPVGRLLRAVPSHPRFFAAPARRLTINIWDGFSIDLLSSYICR